MWRLSAARRTPRSRHSIHGKNSVGVIDWLAAGAGLQFFWIDRLKQKRAENGLAPSWSFRRGCVNSAERMGVQPEPVQLRHAHAPSVGDAAAVGAEGMAMASPRRHYEPDGHDHGKDGNSFLFATPTYPLHNVPFGFA